MLKLEGNENNIEIQMSEILKRWLCCSLYLGIGLGTSRLAAMCVIQEAFAERRDFMTRLTTIGYYVGQFIRIPITGIEPSPSRTIIFTHPHTHTHTHTHTNPKENNFYICIFRRCHRPYSGEPCPQMEWFERYTDDIGSTTSPGHRSGYAISCTAGGEL